MIEYNFEMEIEPGTFSVNFKLSNPLKWYEAGKAWPRQTECKIYFEGSLLGSSIVVKHCRDKGSDKIGILKSAKKAVDEALPGRINKIYRTRMWELIKNI